MEAPSAEDEEKFLNTQLLRPWFQRIIANMHDNTIHITPKTEAQCRSVLAQGPIYSNE